MAREFVTHIGFPKTGTTLLQKHVYPHLKNYQYLDYATCKKLFYTLIYKDDLDYRPDKAKKRLDEVTNNERILASYESLTGPLWYNGLNRSSIPHRLKELGVTKVIITIRNQINEIDSCYRQYIQEGGILSFEEAVKTQEEFSWKNIIDLDYFNYFALIQLYAEVFGRQNVLVIPSELMKEDLEGTVGRIETFINAPSIDETYLNKAQNQSSNKSLSNLSLRILRITNHFTRSKFKPSHLIHPAITTWKVRNFLQKQADPHIISKISDRANYVKNSSLEETVKEHYQASNTKLANQFQLDLKSLGYPLL